MSSDKSLIVFKAIVTFVNDLNELFSKEQHSLRLYSHLLNKTTLAHEKAIQKNIDAFTLFCVTNREAILSKDTSKILEDRVTYSEKCYVDIKKIFQKADSESSGVIWKHLLLLSALLDPEARAKEILKKDVSNEGNFLNKILGKVEKEVEGKTNPMEAISAVLQSGVFNEVIQDMNDGFKSGELDLGKMMGTMQNVMGTMPGNPNGGGGAGAMDMGAMNSMMQSILGQMGNPSGPSGGMGNPPDLGALMSSLGGIPPTPSNSSESINKIEEVIENNGEDKDDMKDDEGEDDHEETES